MPETLQQRAARGAVLLIGRSILQKLVTVSGSVVLARLLAPKEFGIYAIVSFIVTFFTIFSDVGLGAALIQQREQPSREELTTTFTSQLLLVSVVIAIGFLAAGWISSLYHLSAAGVWLIRILLLSLPVGLLRTIPALLLERNLSYGRLSIVESIEDVSFQATAVILALLHCGVWSFVWAALVRGILGVCAAYIVSPWSPGIGFSMNAARRLIRFGLLYQLQGALSFVKDSMTSTLLALVIGASAVGYINWAFALATLPLMVTSPLWRVTFPAFSRAQGDLALLRDMVEHSVRLSAIIFLPISLLLIGAAPQIVHYIYTDKWLPALPAFYLFAIAMWTGPLLGSTFFSTFYATGHAKLALYFTVLYCILDWAIGIPLVLMFGFNGIAIRTVLVAYGTLPVLLFALWRIIPARVVRQIARSFAAACIAGIVEFTLLLLLPGSIAFLILAASCSALLYAAMIVVWERAILRVTLVGVLPKQLHTAFRWYLVSP